MKKIVVVIACIALTGCVNAQWGKRVKGNGNKVTKTRTVGEFDEVYAGGSFDVKLVAGQEGKITIKMDENLLDYLITEVKNGELVIKWKKGHNISYKNEILITVPFTDIDRVALSGSGDVYSEAVIRADNLKATLSGSGDLNLRVDTNNLDTGISGSGDIRLSGEADFIDGGISGSGDIHAYDLKTKEADLSIAGSGGIKISVSDKLKARIAGSGDIFYKGNPAKQDVKVSGSGSVESK